MHAPDSTTVSPRHTTSAANPYKEGGAAPVVSFFEFWPAWMMYTPVVLQWLWLSLRYRSFTLPLLANPAIPLGGMVGAPKSAVLAPAGEELQRAILPWCTWTRSEGEVAAQLPEVLDLMQRQGMQFPVVFKPDCGCRGAGVKKICSGEEIGHYLQRMPAGADIFIQQLASHESEAGIFYVRHPEAEAGQVVSLTLKHMPSVTGTGQHTLEQLVSRQPRAALKSHLYRERLGHRWNEVIPAGQEVSLLFSASHCRGAVFCDARSLITPALEARINHLMRQLPDFHYGRLDVKFRDLDALQAGETLEIIEINGASAELIHIWDSRTGFLDALRSLLWQYRTLTGLGAWQRARGARPPGVMALLKGWRRERAVTRHFPVTD